VIYLSTVFVYRCIKTNRRHYAETGEVTTEVFILKIVASLDKLIMTILKIILSLNFVPKRTKIYIIVFRNFLVVVKSKLAKKRRGIQIRTTGSPTVLVILLILQFIHTWRVQRSKLYDQSKFSCWPLCKLIFLFLSCVNCQLVTLCLSHNILCRLLFSRAW